MRHKKIIDQLFLLAQDSVMVAKARVYAALVYQNKIISYGCNQEKSHPMAKKFAKNEFANKPHAEISCIRNALKRYPSAIIAKSTLYVARAKHDDSHEWVIGMAKPCEGCAKCIHHFGIKKVVFSTNDPYVIGNFHL